MTAPVPLSSDAFRDMIADALGLDVARVTPEAYFIADLGVDSIRMIEILLRLEEMNIRVSPELAWQIHTVDDAYRYYQEQVSGQTQ